jgi:tryptophan-rich sensory protein
MKREPSETRGKKVISLLILVLLIVTILFGFIMNKPTSLVGLGVIITFIVFVICVVVLFLYNIYKKQRSLR